jgi:signal transduction histidine kinase
VSLDRDQVFRIFLNIGRNSADAIRAAQQADGVICVSAREEAGDVWVTMSDNGPGLPETARESLFQPFTGSTRAGGTGLGLAIARELARGHNGDVTLLSSDAAGTAFQVRLGSGTADSSSAEIDRADGGA